MVHPGIIRKNEDIKENNRNNRNLNEGPISLLVSYILDIFASMAKLILNMSSGFRMSGSKFVYDMVYKDGAKLIPSSEKYGTIVSLKPFRVILCIMYPPLGVFLSRGIYGIHYAIFALILTYFNVLFGICFALIITHIPLYADKFAKYDYYRILTIRQLINNCRNTTFNDTKEIIPLILFIGSILLIISIFYIFTKYL
jgi:uncharacterized membrane protein YqaE (UPF0057 family)